jgi:hypothetical protein
MCLAPMDSTHLQDSATRMAGGRHKIQIFLGLPASLRNPTVALAELSVKPCSSISPVALGISQRHPKCVCGLTHRNARETSELDQLSCDRVACFEAGESVIKVEKFIRRNRRDLPRITQGYSTVFPAMPGGAPYVGPPRQESAAWLRPRPHRSVPGCSSAGLHSCPPA